jgi:hypothetical protein
MKRYDPLVPPDPDEWRALDESRQHRLVEEYHRRARVKLPNETIHAIIHSVIENQILLGDETPVQRTLQRLMGEGLDRHEAIHAIGMVLAEFIFDILRQSESSGDPNPAYFAAVEKITAEEWRRSG